MFCRVWNTRRCPEWCVVVEWLSSGISLCSRWPQPSHMSRLPVPVVFWVSHNRDFKIQRRGRQRESRKINRFYEQTTTLNKKTKFYLFLNMVMVPRNSTPGGFAYIRQSKWVMIAIKTERTQIHFLSDVLVAVTSLDLKVPNGSLRRRRDLIAVSNVCEVAPRFLFDAPNGPLNQLSEGRLHFPSTRTNHGAYSILVHSRRPEEQWRKNEERRRQRDKHQKPSLLVRLFTVVCVKFVFCWMWRTMKLMTPRRRIFPPFFERRCDQSCFRCRRRCDRLSSSNHIHWDHRNRKQNQNKTSNKTNQQQKARHGLSFFFLWGC